MVKKMKVKIFDEGHEKDLEQDINEFLGKLNKKVIDIKYSSSVGIFSGEQIYCFTAMIIYEG